VPPPTFAHVGLAVEGAVARLELCRPEKLNALSPRMLEEVAAAAGTLASGGEITCVVVCGAGRAFSSGFDLGAMAEGYAEPKDARATAAIGRRAADAIAGIPAVTVAAVHGRCVGGGLVLAAACDLVVAVAWGGVPALVRAVGAARAKELILTCRPFDGAEAHAIGLATRLVEPGAARTAAEELAREIAGRGRLNTAATKAHAAAAAAGTPASADGELDALVAALADTQAAEVRARYLEALAARRRDRA